MKHISKYYLQMDNENFDESLLNVQKPRR